MSLDRMDLTAPAFEVSAPDAVTRVDVQAMAGQAQSAAGFLKALSHEGRLMILCHLGSGERSVTELERLLDTRQAAVSQQLARLRLEGLVHARRDGKAIYYSIQDPRVMQTIRLMSEMFCTPA